MCGWVNGALLVVTYNDADHGVFSQDPEVILEAVVKYVVGMNC